MGISPRYRSLRGMPDILPESVCRMRWVQDTARGVFKSFGFREIQTPVMEETDVFIRSIGEDTDIVEKEMYTLTDRGGKSVSLRPEGTAPIIRAYIEHGWYSSPDLVKLFYFGPMFRGERPQKGRLRQFHQIGVEMIGGRAPLIDVELISSLDRFLKELGLDGYTVMINSLGCSADRAAYKKKLSDYLRDKKDKLCENCARRAEKNVLRVLDCKSENCRKAVQGAPSITGNLCPDCGAYYSRVVELLKASSIPCIEKADLVRGLDYYTGTIFEVVHPALGAQDAIAAGGRYDDLTKEMGGPDTGATGYAVGVERLLLAAGGSAPAGPEMPLMVIPMGEEFSSRAFGTLSMIRSRGVAAEMDMTGRSFKAQLKKANKDGRRFVVIIGENEIKEDKVTLKDMREGTQSLVGVEEAVETIRNA